MSDLRIKFKQTLAIAFFSGMISGFISGITDIAWSWKLLPQFLPATGDKFFCMLFTSSLYGIFGGFLAAILALFIFLFWHTTDFRKLITIIIEKHNQKRAAGYCHALTGLSFSVSSVLLLGVALAGAFFIGYETIKFRHHQALIVALIMMLTIGYSLSGLVITFFLARIIEYILKYIARGFIGRILSHPLAIIIAPLLMIISATTGIFIYAWDTIKLIPLRPYYIGIYWLFFLIIISIIIKKLAVFEKYGKTVHAFLLSGLLIILTIIMITTGRNDAIRKGMTSFSGAGDNLISALYFIFDFDRDGFSSILGGEDCNDFNASIYPGAFDIPDDGIDQNCMGGDFKTRRNTRDFHFVKLTDNYKNLNIILITIDALRRDHIGAYGYKRQTTPTIDTLARSSTIFKNSWAHGPSTRYSIPTIITGRYTDQILWDTKVWWPALKAENKTLAEYLKEEGYYTGAILSYNYFDPIRRINQGFDYYNNENARLHQGRDPASTKGSSSKEQADLTIEFLNNHKDNKFFLWVHFYDPHYQYELHPEVVSFGNSPVDKYDNEIRFTDYHIERVFKTLRELGLYNKTAIVIAGDHGEGFGEHGIKLHGYHLYEAQTNVPLIIHIPGAKAKQISMPAGLVDIVPTLVNLGGGVPEQSMSGRSLIGEVIGTSNGDQDRTLFQSVQYEGPTERRAAVNSKWHLIYNMIPAHTYELYDIENDPEETHDLWGQKNVDPLKQELLTWIDMMKFPPEGSAKISKAILKKAPSPEIPLHINFDDTLLLEGIDLSTKTPKRGGSIEIKWYFKCLEKIHDNWKIFVHIEGPSRFLGDHSPVDGLFPFTMWSPGQYISDQQKIHVPHWVRTGNYKIFMGLFDKNKRMSVTNSGSIPVNDNRLEVLSLTIE